MFKPTDEQLAQAMFEEATDYVALNEELNMEVDNEVQKLRK